MARSRSTCGTGKRKTSVARVILRPGDGATWVNGRSLEEYFPRADAPRRSRSRRSASPASRARYDLRVRVARRRARPARPARSATGSPARSSRPIPSCACRSSARASSPATPASSSARRPASTRPARRRSSRSAKRCRVSRLATATRSRDVATRGEAALDDCRPPRAAARRLLRDRRRARGRRRDLTRARRAARRARSRAGAGAARVLVGRDTRGSGPELEEALARGLAAGGSRVALGGVLPTPAVALLAASTRRRRLRLAQPARVQRRQVLRPRGAQARRRRGGCDRGAARRAAARERRGGRPRRRRSPTLRRASSSSGSAADSPACASPSTAPTAP